MSKNIWEVERRDQFQSVRFFGHIETVAYAKDPTDPSKAEQGNLGLLQSKWVGGQTVRVMACDIAQIGYNTFSANCLRQWKCIDEPHLTNYIELEYSQL